MKARRYVRLAFMLKGQIKEKYVYPELAAALRLVIIGCWAFLPRVRWTAWETVGEGFYARNFGGGRASRTGQREAPSAHPRTVRVSVKRRITFRRAGVSGEVSRLFDLDCQPARSFAAVLGPLGGQTGAAFTGIG